MDINYYVATSVIGGAAGSLDSIDPTNTDGALAVLGIGDICRVVEDTCVSTYIAKSAAGQSEYYPDIVIPNVNPGNWYWQLVVEQIEALDFLAYNNIPGGF